MTAQALIDQWRLHPSSEVGSCANQLAGWLRTQIAPANCPDCERMSAEVDRVIAAQDAERGRLVALVAKHEERGYVDARDFQELLRLAHDEDK